MVGTPWSPLAPLGGPTVNVFYVDGGYSRISISTSQGAAIDVSWCWWWKLPDLQHRHLLGGPPSMFVTLMVGAPGSLSTPPWGPTIGIFYVDGGCSWISISTGRGGVSSMFLNIDGGRCQRFLALIEGAPRSTAPEPPRELVVDVLRLGGSRSQTSGNASMGPLWAARFTVKVFSGPCAAKDLGMKTIASTVMQKVDNRARHRRVGPTCGFVASSEVGLGASIGTLQTGYPYIQASSQDKL
jgi:hypothetical protein